MKDVSREIELLIELGGLFGEIRQIYETAENRTKINRPPEPESDPSQNE